MPIQKDTTDMSTRTMSVPSDEQMSRLTVPQRRMIRRLVKLRNDEQDAHQRLDKVRAEFQNHMLDTFEAGVSKSFVVNVLGFNRSRIYQIKQRLDAQRQARAS